MYRTLGEEPGGGGSGGLETVLFVGTIRGCLPIDFDEPSSFGRCLIDGLIDFVAVSRDPQGSWV